MNLDRFCAQAPSLGVLGVMVSQDGTLLARHDWDDGCRRNIYSASKSVTATAVGIAQAEGLLSIGEKLTDAFADDLPAVVSPRLAKATVRDLLTMSLGQEKPFLMGAQRWELPVCDWVKAALNQPFSHDPGEAFLYNNVGPYLAGILVQRRAGCNLVDYLMPRLFTPLGIPRPTWETDPDGRTFGAGGLMLTMPEMHKLGQLWLNRGQWEGRQLIPAEWVDECARKQVENGREGYGYLFWRGTNNSWRADGKYCQLIIMAPDKEAVVTIQAECRRGSELLRLIDEEIMPQL